MSTDSGRVPGGLPDHALGRSRRPDEYDSFRFTVLHPRENFSVVTPERSVPMPANAFSISSQNTMTRGGSTPFRIASRKRLMLAHRRYRKTFRPRAIPSDRASAR